MDDLIQYIKDGVINPNDIIKLCERDVKNGKITPDVLTYTIKFMNMISYLNTLPEGQYVNIDKLVELGFYDSREEVDKVMNEHYADIKDHIRNTPIIPYVEPSNSEISQNIYSSDPDKVCIVCTHRRRHTIIVPCGHLIMCTVCSKKIVTTANTQDVHATCPICKTNIEKIQKIFP